MKHFTLALVLAFPAAAFAQDPKWLKLEVARALAQQNGKPIVVYTGGAIKDGTTKDMKGPDEAWGDAAVRKHHESFNFVKVFNKSSGEAVGAKAKGEVIIFDPDFKEIQRTVIENAADLSTALTTALNQFGPKQINWLQYTPEDLKAAREDGKKLLVVAFWADLKESNETLKALEDVAVAKLHDKCSFIKIAFKKDSEEAKLWGAAAPTVLIVDPTKEPGLKAVIEKAAGKRDGPAFRALILKALKALEKK